MGTTFPSHLTLSVLGALVEDTLIEEMSGKVEEMQ